MAESHVTFALKDKAHELRQAIVTYEELLERTRKELAVVTATLTLFQRTDHRTTIDQPAHIRNLFKRGEPLSICKAALSVEPDGLTTRQLAVCCLAAREFDHEDPVLVRAMVGVLSNTLKKAVRRGVIAKGEGRESAAVWKTGEISLMGQ